MAGSLRHRDQRRPHWARSLSGPTSANERSASYTNAHTYSNNNAVLACGIARTKPHFEAKMKPWEAHMVQGCSAPPSLPSRRRALERHRRRPGAESGPGTLGEIYPRTADARFLRTQPGPSSHEGVGMGESPPRRSPVAPGLNERGLRSRMPKPPALSSQFEEPRPAGPPQSQSDNRCQRPVQNRESRSCGRVLHGVGLSRSPYAAATEQAVRFWLMGRAPRDVMSQARSCAAPLRRGKQRSKLVRAFEQGPHEGSHDPRPRRARPTAQRGPMPAGCQRDTSVI
ncbi:hypothetical protein BV20DRAFT_606861 [Pilatotrama ljubarskyi]|nr:hypothetical protein BV20DRAFT_606861 [Pilatotrama ljubarskyi]